MLSQETLILNAKYGCTNDCFDSHFHSAYEIMFVRAGRIQVRIGSKDYIAQKNSFLLFGNLEDHAATLLEAPFERYFATISPLIADRLINEPVLTSLLKNRPADFCHVFDVSDLEQDFVHFYETILSEKPYNLEFSNEFCAISLKKLLIKLYRVHPERFPAMESNISSVICDVQKYIDSFYMQPIVIEELARNFYIDLYYLSHCFKNQTGYSPKQYLIKTRLSHAKEMLLHTKEPIGNISYKCGFSDVNNFIRIFKTDTNMTPNKYRKQEHDKFN